MDCFVALLLAMTERATARPSSISRIGNHVARHQSVPDEQNHQRADRCGDEACALIRTVMADGLADKGREKRAGDAKHRCQEESAGIVRARRKQPRDDAGDEADDNDPENAAHGCRPLSRKRLTPYLSMISAQTLRVCREGKPVRTFPDHARQSRPANSLSDG